MKLNYYADTDSLYIDLSELPSAESREISEGVVLDFDAKGNLVGIDIDNASAKVQLKDLVLSNLPSKVETIASLIRLGSWPSHLERELVTSLRNRVANESRVQRFYTRLGAASAATTESRMPTACRTASSVLRVRLPRGESAL